MDDKYNPRTYWENRLSRRLDIATVGQKGLGFVYNGWLYRARFRAIRRAIKKLKINISGKSLIDIGVGSGAWIPFWERLQPGKIVGFDITSASVSNLRTRYPHILFFQGDICSQNEITFGERFDVVTAFDILFHITEDTAFSNAISNLSKMVECDGWVIISDSFCSNSWGPIYHEYHRSYDVYLRELESAGLKPIHVEPIFFAMTTNICSPDSKYDEYLSRLAQAALRLVNRLSRRQSTEWMNYLIGCGLYFIDNVFNKIVSKGPSLNVLFARKQHSKIL